MHIPPEGGKDPDSQPVWGLRRGLRAEPGPTSPPFICAPEPRTHRWVQSWTSASLGRGRAGCAGRESLRHSNVETPVSPWLAPSRAASKCCSLAPRRRHGRRRYPPRGQRRRQAERGGLTGKHRARVGALIPQAGRCPEGLRRGIRLAERAWASWPSGTLARPGNEELPLGEARCALQQGAHEGTGMPGRLAGLAAERGATGTAGASWPSLESRPQGSAFLSSLVKA